MRIHRLVLALILVLASVLPVWSADLRGYPANPFFQSVRFTGGTSLTGSTGTLTLAGGQLILPPGTPAAPSLTFLGMTNYGLYTTLTTDIYFVAAGTRKQRFASTAVDLASDVFLTWDAASNMTSGDDLFLSREGPAILQQGQDAASPVAQTFKGPDGSGTDKAGGDLTGAAGRGTGTGAGGTLYFATAPAGGVSGAGQNALVNRVAVLPVGGLTWLTTAEPTCNSTTRGTVNYVAGAVGVLDTFKLCRKDAADVYAWVTLF